MSKTYRLFLASSSELAPERIAAAAAIADFAALHPEHRVVFQTIKWENFAATYEDARKQSQYNASIPLCEVFLMLYWTKVGRYTKEEFDVANEHLAKNGKPLLLLLRKADGAATEPSVAEFEQNIPHGNGLFNARFQDATQLRWLLLEELQKLFKDKYLAPGQPANLLSLTGVSEPSVFLGREDELKTIRERLDKGGRLMLINAEGGIGKTTLAAKYWHDSLHRYKHNAWLFCENGIINALKELAPGLNLDLKGMDEAQQLAALKHALKQVHDDCLLVLDNANDENDIKIFKQHFEGFHWHVLLTSRCAGVLDKTQELPITHLPPPLAKELFQRNYKEDTPEFVALLNRLLLALQYHTLSVELFGKTMAQLSERGLTFAQFVQQLETEGLFLGKRSFSILTDYTTNTRIEATNSDEILDRFYNFAKLTEPERYWLVNMALLPAEEYNFLFLCGLFDQDSMEFDTLHTLARKGWLTKTEANFKINPVIQAIALRKNAATLGTDATALIDTLNALLVNDGNYFKMSFEQAAPYVKPIAHIGQKLQGFASLELASLFFKAAIYHQNGGDRAANFYFLVGFKTLNEQLLEKEATPHLLREISVALSKLGDFYLRLGNAKKAEEHYVNGLTINKKLAALDAENTRWQQDLATSLSKLGDFYLRLGDAKQAEKHYVEALVLRRSLSELDGGNTSWQQDLATSLSKLGDFYLRLGDAKQAEKHYVEGLAINKSLSELDGGNTSWQQDLATSLSKLGDFYLRLGDAKQAEKHYMEGLAINKSLSELDGGNTRWQQDLATSLSKLGDFYLRLGDAKQAEKHYVEGLAIFRSLSELDGGNTSWQQDLATSLSKLGDFYLRLGDAKQAEKHYVEGLAINKSLSELDGGNTRWQQDLATSLSKLGDFYLRLGDAKQAEKHYVEALVLRRSLSELDGGNTSWQQDLATSLSKLGDFYLRLGDAKQAEKHYVEDLKISRSLSELDGGNTSWQQDLATSLSKLGDFYLRLGDAKKAEEHYVNGLAINKKLAALDAENTRWQQDLATSLSKLGDFYLQQSKAQEALDAYVEAKAIHEKLLAIDSSSVQFLFDYALDFLRIGRVYQSAGYPQEATTIMKNGQGILQDLVQQMPDEVNFKEHLAMVEGWLEALEKP